MLIWALTKNHIRQSLEQVFKALFVTPIIVSAVLMLFYIVLEVVVLSRIGLWDISQLKSTIIWGMTIATIMLFQINNIIEDSHFFTKAVKDSIRFTVFIDFIVNLYVFSLIIEFILVPIAALIGGMLAVAETNEKYKPVQKLLNDILIMFGLWIFGYAFYHILSDFRNLAKIQTLKDLALPPVMLLMFLPFIYCVALFAQYEILFTRLQFIIKDPSLLRFTKRQLLINYNFKIRTLEQWAKTLPVQSFRNQQDILNSIKKVDEIGEHNNN
ncbi:MAG: hypothetical protein PHH44_01385 [bacterium]|nr:hypothetical protein [bacterium]